MENANEKIKKMAKKVNTPGVPDKPKYHSKPGEAKGAVYSKDLSKSDPTAWAKSHMRKERDSLTRHGKEVLAKM